MVITGIHSITAVGHTAEMTAASVRAGISRLTESVDFYDGQGHPITCARIDGIDYDANAVVRLNKIAIRGLEDLIHRYLPDGLADVPELFLMMGVASPSRPGPRYEGPQEELLGEFVKSCRQLSAGATIKCVKTGNAAAISCLATAEKLLEENPRCHMPGRRDGFTFGRRYADMA